MLYLVLDIGGTKISAGVADETGRISGFRQSPTDAQKGAQHVLECCFRLSDSIMDEFSGIKAVGIASAGRINTADGIVKQATSNLPGWAGMPLARLFRERYGIPAAIENDVNAAALGEYRTGAGVGFESIVCLWIGTGLGGAFIKDGKVLNGAHWSGAELGHMLFKAGGRQCNCGLGGCAEQYVSGNAIIRSYNELCSDSGELCNDIGKGKVDSALEVFRRYSLDDQAARQVVDTFIEDLSTAIIHLGNVFDPSAFILGGGVLGASDIWLDRVRCRVAGYVPTPVLSAILGGNAGLVGAGMLAAELAGE